MNEQPRKSAEMAKKPPIIEEPTKTTTDVSKESFICIDHTGLIYSLTIESNHIRDGQLALPEDVLYANVRAMDFKRELMIFGDSEGNLTRFNARTRQTRSILVRRNAEIRKIRFSPARESLLISVQFPESVDILDASSVTLDVVCSLKCENSKTKILDSCWFGPDRVLVQFSNHTLRVFQVGPSSKPNRVVNLFTSVLNSECGEEGLDENAVINLKNSILDLSEDSGLASSVPSNLSTQLKDYIKNQMAGTSKLDKLASLSSYFNPRSFETKFWNLLLYQKNHVLNNVVKQSPLLMNLTDFREVQKEALRVYREKCDLSENVKTSVLTRDLFLINELDSVFNLLIETEPKDDHYSYNLIK